MKVAPVAMALPVSDDVMLEVGTLHQKLDHFFANIERRVLRVVEISVGNRDDALDIVQEAMIRFAQTYATRDATEWRPLFYRIAQNGARDWHRRRIVRQRVMKWFGEVADDSEETVLEQVPDRAGRGPRDTLQIEQAMGRLELALGELPARQVQAFTLRNFEGMNVAETAIAMGCSSGSVKTHYFRALKMLRARLGDHWE
jgi:RNA polymerase sigma-70 factor (ECF subfamily)